MNNDTGTFEAQPLDYKEITANLIAAYVSNNHVSRADLGTLIANTHAALVNLTTPVTSSSPAVEKLTPSQIKKSITPDALISFEDGKGYKTLRRHLTQKGITPEAYRAKWGLPSDYPMTAQSYSEARSALAKSLGLGQIRRKTEPVPEPTPATEPPKKRGRKKGAEASATQ